MKILKPFSTLKDVFDPSIPVEEHWKRLVRDPGYWIIWILNIILIMFASR